MLRSKRSPSLSNLRVSLDRLNDNVGNTRMLQIFKVKMTVAKLDWLKVEQFLQKDSLR